MSKNVNDLLRTPLFAASSCPFISTNDTEVLQPTVPLPSAMRPQKWDVVSNKHLQFIDGSTRSQTEAGAEPEDVTPDLQWQFLPLGSSFLEIRADRLETQLFASYRLLTARHTIPADARSPGRGDPQMLERESSTVQLLMAREPKKRPVAAVRPRLWAEPPLDALRPSPMWCVLSIRGPILPQSHSSKLTSPWKQNAAVYLR